MVQKLAVICMSEVYMKLNANADEINACNSFIKLTPWINYIRHIPLWNIVCKGKVSKQYFNCFEFHYTVTITVYIICIDGVMWSF